MKHLAPSAHFNYKNRSMRAFTLPELAVVIVVLAILIAASYFGFSTWRDRVAETELKSDLTGVAAAMDSARNWSKGYPELAEGVTFDGSEATKAIFTQSEHVILTYYEGDDKEYCIDAVSKARPSIAMFYNSTSADKAPKKGTCLGGEGYVPNPNQTIFVYDTRLANCNGTVQLPITSPTSAPGSTITWGDGQTSSLTSSLQSHTYSTPGRYMVTYDGPITTVSTVGTATASRGCLKELRQWSGSISPTAARLSDSMNLTYVAEPPHSVTDMVGLFYNNTSFNQPIGNWDVSNVTNMRAMFRGAGNFNQPIGDWNVSKVTTMEQMFLDATKFNQPLNNWNVSNVTSMSELFMGLMSGKMAFNQPLDNWNTSKVTNMGSMFRNTAFNRPINNWNVSNVTNMETMFYLSDFNQPLNNWDVSKVTSMQMMLAVTPFNQSINNWNVSNVTNMESMFYGAESFNQPLNNWNTSKVTNIRQMFANAFAFNQPLSNWDVSKVTNMSGVFQSPSWNSSFNQPLNNWNTSSVVSMEGMFQGAKVFNQPLNNWNTGNVTGMNTMFYAAQAFNQDLSGWNVSKVSPKPPTNFAQGATAWTQPKPVW